MKCPLCRSRLLVVWGNRLAHYGPREITIQCPDCKARLDELREQGWRKHLGAYLEYSRAMEAIHINLRAEEIERLMFKAGQEALDALGEERPDA